MSQISNRDFLKALATALLALVISVAILIPAYLVLFPTLHPEFSDSRERSAKPMTLRGTQFRPVVFGDGGIEGSSAVISQLAKGRPADQAVLLHQRRFNAADYPFLRHHIEGWHPGLRVMLFWRRADDPQTNHYSELDYTGDGTGYFNLLRSEEWRGQIVELAVGFFGELRGEPVKLHEVGLEPYGVEQVLKVVWGEWTSLTVWRQSSINRIHAIPEGGIISPVAAFSMLFALSAALLTTVLLLNRQQKAAFFAVLISGLVCWILLDLLWQRRLDWQLQETRYLFAGKDMHERKLADMDGELYRTIHHIKENVLPEPGPVIWILTEERDTYEALRTKYHLTPHQTLYQHDAHRTQIRMRQYGHAKESHYLLALGTLSRLNYNPGTGLLKYYRLCGAAKQEFKDSQMTLYRLTEDLIRCKGK